ncbi:hypothetical protein UA08_07721 [Talaromyces atroroseus]|uniref:Uncharacterized protein n=1 Tax=Talaromyces atroroseus TaxID=1441469 RepID=A0A225AFH8_TALAT|nr:hypothetical protein UA08_07721 [Talaromyces atroroseus]OKL56824.1 hypothetical protein UA08_07721 [Talaromyces atroroseus]
MSVVKRFIHILGTCDEEDSFGMTPLALAAKHSDIQLCQIFLEAGARVEATIEFPRPGGQDSFDSQRRASPLWYAVSKPGNTDLVSLLISYGADVSLLCYGKELIRQAVQNSDVHVVELLLRAGANPKAVSTTGTLLHAVKDPEIAKLLLLHGLDVNEAVGEFHPPIIAAVIMNRSEVVQCFPEAGAKTNIIAPCCGESLLSMAIRKGYSNIVQMLINAGCDVNNQNDEFGTPPLHLATLYNQESMCRMLIKAGADISQEYSEDILFTAAQWSSPSLFQFLIDSGADIEAEDSRFRTPLFRAIECGREEIVQLLLDANAYVTTGSLDRIYLQPAIYITAGLDEGLTKIFSYLRSYSLKAISTAYPSINTVSGDLDTHISMIKMFLDHGLDFSEAKFRGLGILHYAVWRNNAELVETLLEGHADPKFEDPDGYTAADWAVALGFVNIERILREEMWSGEEFDD